MLEDGPPKDREMSSAEEVQRTVRRELENVRNVVEAGAIDEQTRFGGDKGRRQRFFRRGQAPSVVEEGEDPRPGVR